MSVGAQKAELDQTWESGCATHPAPIEPLNPCELEIDLFCKGMRVDSSCALEEDARPVQRTRAGLGSGLELIIPGGLKDVWVNVPVEEAFARRSCYRLIRESGAYWLVDERQGFRYTVHFTPEPAWYERVTSRGTPMHHIGVLQGTYLGIYISNACGFWYHSPAMNCRFCTTGLNVGVEEAASKDLEEVVEVARAAREESAVTFVHFNSGYQTHRDLDRVAPYVKAVKSRVGALVGVQVIPTLEFWKYDRLIELGADHFSFCYEFHNPDYFARLCPGKANYVGQETFFRALEYCARKLGKGTCSGEIMPASSRSRTLCAPSTTSPVWAPFPPCVFSGRPSARPWRVTPRLATKTCEWRLRMFTRPVDGTTSPWT